MLGRQPTEAEILAFLQKREHRHEQGFGHFLIAKVKTRNNHGSGGSMTWLDLETNVLVPCWLSPTTELTNTSGLVAAVPSPAWV